MPRNNVSGIRRPAAQANNFELRPALISMVQQNQFSGATNEDPNDHLDLFIELSDTVKQNGVSEEAIRLHLFSFSLKDGAKRWLKSLPPNSITTWDELAAAFLKRYFPPSKGANIRSEISQFKQQDGETLFDGWERYKNLVKK